MKKNIFGLLILILFSLFLFNLSCKKTDETDGLLQKPQGLFVITSGISKAMYFSNEDLTYLVMNGRVLCQNEIGGTITSWQFIFKSGNTALLEINKTNYSSYVLYTYGQPIMSAYNSGIVNVSYADKSHENFSPYQGKLFNANPDNMDIFFTITDDNANIQTISFNTAVIFDSY